MTSGTNLDRCRRFVLSLPEVTEEPHHHMLSFRVRGKIFATIPPGNKLLHIFVDEERRELALAMNPDAYEALHWGKNIVGIRAQLENADHGDIEDLLESAWRRKAPDTLRGEG